MLFQKTIIKKYLGLLKEEAVSEAWNKFQAYFLDVQIQANIQQSKEERNKLKEGRRSHPERW